MEVGHLMGLDLCLTAPQIASGLLRFAQLATYPVSRRQILQDLHAQPSANVDHFLAEECFRSTVTGQNCIEVELREKHPGAQFS